jgi:hypothetical protein
MVITNSGSTQEEWKTQNMCRLQFQQVIEVENFIYSNSIKLQSVHNTC